MKLFDAYGRPLREIHTPAIGDCAAKTPETRVNSRTRGSTGQNEADHVCAPVGQVTSAHAAFREGGA